MSSLLTRRIKAATTPMCSYVASMLGARIKYKINVGGFGALQDQRACGGRGVLSELREFQPFGPF